MSSTSKQQNQFGWDEWFESRAQEHGLTEHGFARVIAVDRDQLLVINESGEFRAKLSGRFLHTTEHSSDYPCVGDWVSIQYNGSDTFGIIHSVVPRKTFLRRKEAGDSIKYQMIASNVDVGLIVQSCHFDFNINRLERYLVMVTSGHVEPVVLLTKTDLITPETLQQQINEIRQAGITREVITLSNVTGEGISRVCELLQPEKTYCLLGSSGVGKSTLINHFIEHRVLETNEVSATGEGRHTTVRRELYIMKSGAMLIDNPGMREFGILGAVEGLDNSYADIHELASSCKFGNCSHSNEPGCAVLNAIEEGTLSRQHYENFNKLRNESDFREMSHQVKRKKDRAFGRYKQTAKKDLGNIKNRDY